MTSPLATPDNTISAADPVPAPGSPAGGWKAFYQSLTKAGNVPNASITSIRQNNAVFQDNYLELADIQAQLTSANITPLITTIYADVLNISGTLVWNLSDDTGLVIYARLITFDSNASFTITNGVQTANGIADFMLFGNSTDQPITIYSANGTPNQLTINTATISPGILVGFTVNGFTNRTLTLQDGFPASITAAQESYLNNSYVLAALSSDQYPGIAVDILQWVNQWAGACCATSAADLSQIYFASANLATLFQSQIIAKQSGATYVPFLSSSVYQTIATALNQNLTSNEQSYLTLFSASNASNDFIQAAQTLQSTYANTAAETQQLLTQAESDYQQALAAVQQATLNFQNQQSANIDLENTLKANIANYELHNSITEALNICKAIVTFGAAIAGMAVGDEATAPAAAESAITAAKSASTLANDMKQLKKLIEALKKLYDLAQSLYTSAGKLSQSVAITPTTSPQGLNQYDAINGVAAWSIYRLQAEQNMHDVVKLKIAGAREYLTGLKSLAVYGQAQSAAQIAAIKASQNVVALQVKLYYINKNATAVQNLINSLTAGETQILNLQQLFYNHFLNAKLSLYSVLKSYQATYFYWALKPSSVNASLTDLSSITGGLDNLLNMSFDNYEALISIQPQTMNNVAVAITDPAVISSIQTTGKGQWIIDLDNAGFSNLDRVRFTRVRIWLTGNNLYPSGSQSQVSINVYTNGNYYDRFNDTIYQFNSRGLKLLFEYYVNDTTNPNPDFDFGNGLKGTVAIDGSTAPGFENDYFEPTPFSEWSIDLTNLGNSINFANITQIFMQFEGSAIPQ